MPGITLTMRCSPFGNAVSFLGESLGKFFPDWRNADVEWVEAPQRSADCFFLRIWSSPFPTVSRGGKGLPPRDIQRACFCSLRRRGSSCDQSEQATLLPVRSRASRSTLLS